MGNTLCDIPVTAIEGSTDVCLPPSLPPSMPFPLFSFLLFRSPVPKPTSMSGRGNGCCAGWLPGWHRWHEDKTNCALVVLLLHFLPFQRRRRPFKRQEADKSPQRERGGAERTVLTKCPAAVYFVKQEAPVANICDVAITLRCVIVRRRIPSLRLGPKESAEEPGST